jgi:hypothetical protein
MREGGAFGRGITSKGESVAVSQDEARERERREQVRQMAERNRQTKRDVFSATPGAQVGEPEKPLKIGPPDALIEEERTDSDYVPDMESKGYHVGVVRQPVTEVRGGFTSENESKFAAQPTIDDLKAQHNKAEADDEWQAGTQRATPTLSDDEKRANGIPVERSAQSEKAAEK